MPETGVTDATRSTNFTEEDIANLQMRCILQHALLGGLINIAGLFRPMQLVDDAERTPPVTGNAVVNVKPRTTSETLFSKILNNSIITWYLNTSQLSSKLSCNIIF
jgi:hypothetical protein